MSNEKKDVICKHCISLIKERFVQEVKKEMDIQMKSALTACFLDVAVSEARKSITTFNKVMKEIEAI